MVKLRKRLVTLLLLPLLLTAGCMNRPVQGSVNSFDSNTYLTLATTDGVIQGTKADLANNAFSPSVSVKVVAALNQLITAYDAARAAWLIYHNGNTTSAQQTAVANAMASVDSSTANLTAVKGGGK